MDRSKLRKFAGLGSAAALIGAAFALASPSVGVGPPDGPARDTCVRFAEDVDPKQAPVDTVYDPEKNVVYAYHGGKAYVLQASDPACRASSRARSVIEDAVRTDRDNETVVCREVSEAVAENPARARGRSFDRTAALRFLEQRCLGSG